MLKYLQATKLCAILCVAFFSFSLQASSLSHRADVQKFIKSMVKQHGFHQKSLEQLFDQAQIQPQIIESITRPYEKKNWDVYSQLFLTPQRIRGGIAFWQQNEALLQAAQKKYGVPPSIIVAILGVETLYGERQGNYRVIDALSTLAFNYPRRADFFKKELSEFLLLCREHHTSPLDYVGSYAGAIGKPQFMPSSYRYYADDFKGLDKKDLMNDNEAVIASVANYFRKHGWQSNQPVAQVAMVRGNQYKNIDRSLKTASYSLSNLQKFGISPLSTPFHTSTKAGVIELETNKGPEFWVTYPNFYVITRYNSSPQYALVVYLLSEEIKQTWAKMHAPKNHAFG